MAQAKEELKGRPGEQANFIKQLFETIRNAIPKRANQCKFLIRFNIEVSMFLERVRKNSAAMPNRLHLQNRVLLSQCWNRILKLAQYPGEPKHLLSLLIEQLAEEINDLVSVQYNEERKLHYRVIGAQERTFPSSAALLGPLRRSFSRLHSSGRFSISALGKIGKKIRGYERLIPEPINGDYRPYMCALTFVVNQGVILVMVPWRKAPSKQAPKRVVLSRAFTVFTKGQVSPQTVNRILRSIAAGLKQTARKQ